MTCQACAQAITGGLEYRVRCRGCAARAAARSDAMKRVMQPVSAADKAIAVAELRMLIDRTMAGVPYVDARVDVMSWWRVDRANEGNKEGSPESLVEVTTMNDSKKTEIRVESQEEAKDTSGPRGTYGCACVSRDARECVLMREGYRGDDAGYYDTCECQCHQWRDDDDEYH